MQYTIIIHFYVLHKGNVISMAEIYINYNL